MTRATCTKCQAAEARATECLGMLNEAQARVVDLQSAPVYLVLRDSADGQEIDAFTDYELAKEWAQFIGSEVQEENRIDRATLDAMKSTLTEEGARA